MAVLSTVGGDSSRRRDSIILSFQDAKISVLEFDDSVHGLRTRWAKGDVGNKHIVFLCCCAFSCLHLFLLILFNVSRSNHFFLILKKLLNNITLHMEM